MIYTNRTIHSEECIKSVSEKVNNKKKKIEDFAFEILCNYRKLLKSLPMNEKKITSANNLLLFTKLGRLGVIT